MADNNTPQAPTGDIKIFIDKFNTELDIAIKGLSDIQSNLKNIYADAIAISYLLSIHIYFLACLEPSKFDQHYRLSLEQGQ